MNERIEKLKQQLRETLVKAEYNFPLISDEELEAMDENGRERYAAARVLRKQLEEVITILESIQDSLK
jgi:hypothetical protein